MIRQRLIHSCTIKNGGTLDLNSKDQWATTMELEPLGSDDVGEFVADIEESCNVTIIFEPPKTLITGKEDNVRMASRELAWNYAKKYLWVF